MQRSRNALARVSHLAAGQWGLLTTAQAEKRGISRAQLSRLVASGVLERMEQGVYATATAYDEHLPLRVAWLSLDPTRTAEERLTEPAASGVVSHTSAAALHQLGDLLDDRPELTVPARKQTRRNIRLHVRDLGADEVVLVAGLPTTTVERTVSDLVLDGHDPDHLARIISQAVHRDAIDLDRVAEHVGPMAHRHGQPSGTALVEHLLDLAGLSPDALIHDLAATPAGRGLVAAGRASAITDLLDAAATSTLEGTVTAAMRRQIEQVTKSMTPSIRAAAKIMSSPEMQAIIKQVNSPGFQAAIRAAQDVSMPAAASRPPRGTTGHNEPQVTSNENARGDR